ncbi:hypothetical protein [Nevskia sp.]|uniref:hypothetical protein n=1 Tax=Nevskia sp. TaxID=1929292 RepID=UPI0025D8AEE3|nr:hypothetical protein [Nevskia sp.]
MALSRPLVLRDIGGVGQLPPGAVLAPLPIAVTDGDTELDPGGAAAAGVTAWSTSAETPVHWDGAAWRITAVPHSLNTIRDGQIVTVPTEHNLLVVGTLDIQGDGVLDGAGNVIEVS